MDSDFPNQGGARTSGSQSCEKKTIFIVRKVKLTEWGKCHYTACSGKFSNPSFGNERHVHNDLFQNLWLLTVTNLGTFVNHLSAEDPGLRHGFLESIDLLPLLFEKAKRQKVERIEISFNDWFSTRRVVMGVFINRYTL